MTNEQQTKILARIKKLITLANDAGATEGERDNAMRMAYATLAKYNLDMADVDGVGQGNEEERIKLANTYHGVVWARSISQSIAKLFFCEYFYVRISANTDKCKHYFIGRTSNSTTASQIAQFVVEAVDKEARRSTLAMGEHYSAYRAFGVGAAMKVHERCKQLLAEQLEPKQATPSEPQPTTRCADTNYETPTPGTALILASVYQKEQEANKAFLDNSGTKFKKGAKGHAIYDARAYENGKAFGGCVSLSPQINGSKQQQLTSAYPMYLRVSPDALRDLIECEEGAYQDALAQRDSIGCPIERDPKTHAHIVAQRYTHQLRIDNDDEAVDMYYAVCSGTFQVTDEKNFLPDARKIADWLRPVVQRVKPDMVKVWKEPTGH